MAALIQNRLLWQFTLNASFCYVFKTHRLDEFNTHRFIKVSSFCYKKGNPTPGNIKTCNSLHERGQKIQ
jgi:hypothetical protein